MLSRLWSEHSFINESTASFKYHLIVWRYPREREDITLKNLEATGTRYDDRDRLGLDSRFAYELDATVACRGRTLSGPLIGICL